MSRTLGLIALLALLGGACASEDQARLAEPTGPARIQYDVVRRHTREFATDLADRTAGSQGEQAAAVYILGHLQQAGYLVQLDGVPVGNLVRSTNLVARPPSGEDPEVVVAAAYGTGQGRSGAELTLGLWLELARALRASEPDHSVEFVALGAESSVPGAGGLGSRRLAQMLLDEDLDPLVITLDVSERSRSFHADGAEVTTTGLIELAREQGLRQSPGSGPPDQGQVEVFNQAGLDHMHILGPEKGTGEVLLQYLADYAR